MTCPTCTSGDPAVRYPVDGSPAPDNLCTNSFHTAQSMPTIGLANLKSTCGPHCGVKDNMEGHCDCPECHNGKRGLQGLEKLKSLDGKSVRGVEPV